MENVACCHALSFKMHGFLANPIKRTVTIILYWKCGKMNFNVGISKRQISATIQFVNPHPGGLNVLRDRVRVSSPGQMELQFGLNSRLAFRLPTHLN